MQAADLFGLPVITGKLISTTTLSFSPTKNVNYTTNPLTLLQEGVSVRRQMLLLFEHRSEVAPVLDLESPDVSDGILEPVRLLQCLYRHVVLFGQVDAPLRVVEAVFPQYHP